MQLELTNESYLLQPTAKKLPGKTGKTVGQWGIKDVMRSMRNLTGLGAFITSAAQGY